MKTFNVAIDGPSGAGKSTIARKLAAKLGFIYVDTGAMYRAIGLYAQKKGIDKNDAETLKAQLCNIKLDIRWSNGEQRIFLNGEDVSEEIRTPLSSMYASAVSAQKAVRAFLLETQRELAGKNNVIMDGRDIGTVVLPNADVKIFMTASASARAKRRYDELLAKGMNVEYEKVLSEMEERDRNDATRDIAPCVPAPDSILFDNSSIDVDGCVEYISNIVGEKRKDVL